MAYLRSIRAATQSILTWNAKYPLSPETKRVAVRVLEGALHWSDGPLAALLSCCAKCWEARGSSSTCMSVSISTFHCPSMYSLPTGRSCFGCSWLDPLVALVFLRGPIRYDGPDFWIQTEKFWEELIANFRWCDTDRIKNVSNNSIVACVFVAAVLFTEPYLATIGDTHTDTHIWGGGKLWRAAWDGLRRHDVYTRFHKDWFSHLKVNRVGIHRHRQHGDCISLTSFFFSK
jgi:hypothetical protein